MMKETIQFDDFLKLDLRVGKVLQATTPEWSEKLLEFVVDFGPEIGQKTILSGIRKWYQPEDLLNKSYVFVINLAERKMGKGVSQGMMLMADNDEAPTIVEVASTIAPGTVMR